MILCVINKSAIPMLRFDKDNDMHKDMNRSSVLDKFNIASRISIRVLKCLYGEAFRSWRKVAIAVFGAARQ